MTAIPSGRPASGVVHLIDVAEVLVICVVAPLREHLALRRVVQVGEAAVVELQVGTAELAEPADLLGVCGAQVRPELLDVEVDGGSIAALPPR